jgi:hypothetical protein
LSAQVVENISTFCRFVYTERTGIRCPRVYCIRDWWKCYSSK